MEAAIWLITTCFAYCIFYSYFGIEYYLLVCGVYSLFLFMAVIRVFLSPFQIERMTPAPAERVRTGEVPTTEIDRVTAVPLYDREVEQFKRDMGIPEDRDVVSGRKGDRVSVTDRGMCLYWKMPTWGVRFPFSPFIQSVLMALKCAPVTLSQMAWCYLNSFEALWGQYRREFSNCPLQTPTMGIFLCYYSFITDRSWVTVRQTKNKLFSWSKVDRMPNRFLYLGI